jgi:hypothetical protein
MPGFIYEMEGNVIKTTAFKIMNSYINAWLKQDRDLFASLLHKNVLINECTGYIYKGKKANMTWFETWHKHHNRVTDWHILSFAFDKENESSSFEWDFSCLYKENKNSFKGCSFVTFKDNLIYTLNEYEMKIKKYYPYNTTFST